nr:uncharacterized protein LOC119171252 isoform X2 [Rhipicephalus microplus]
MRAALICALLAAALIVSDSALLSKRRHRLRQKDDNGSRRLRKKNRACRGSLYDEDPVPDGTLCKKLWCACRRHCGGQLLMKCKN